MRIPFRKPDNTQTPESVSGDLDKIEAELAVRREARRQTIELEKRLAAQEGRCYFEATDWPCAQAKGGAYRIESTGDGACVRYAETWRDVVCEVASIMFWEPTKADIESVRGMLQEGIDGDDGWNGESVRLQFEDGSITVTKASLE